MATNGCIRVPARYQNAPREYTTAFRLGSVRSVSRLKSTVANAERANLVASRVGLDLLERNLAERASSLSEEFLFAKLLKSTECVARIDVVDGLDPSALQTLRIGVESSTGPAFGVVDWALLLAEAMTLVYVIRAPLVIPIEGFAKIRIFAGADSPSVPEVSSRLRYVSSFYLPQDRAIAKSMVHAMASRDAADQTGELLCAEAG